MYYSIKNCDFSSNRLIIKEIDDFLKSTKSQKDNDKYAEIWAYDFFEITEEFLTAIKEELEKQLKQS